MFNYLLNKYFALRIHFSPSCKVCELNHNGVCFLAINCFEKTLDKWLVKCYTNYRKTERRQYNGRKNQSNNEIA